MFSCKNASRILDLPKAFDTLSVPNTSSSVIYSHSFIVTYGGIKMLNKEKTKYLLECGISLVTCLAHNMECAKEEFLDAYYSLIQNKRLQHS